MPFTLSHAVLALPVIRTSYFGIAAIAMMAPDLPLYMQWLWCYCVTHEFPTMYTVGLPLAVVLVVVWRLVVRPVLIEFLPTQVASRIPEHWSTAWADGWHSLWGGRGASLRRRVGAAGLILLTIAVGLTTHVLWDAFTHADRWGTQVLPWLTAEFAGLPIERWLQIVFSAGGLALLAWVAWRWFRSADATQQHRRVLPGWFVPAFWLAVLAAPIASLAWSLGRNGGPGADETWLAFVVSAGIRAGVLVLIGVAVLAVVALLARVRSGALTWHSAKAANSGQG